MARFSVLALVCVCVMMSATATAQPVDEEGGRLTKGAISEVMDSARERMARCFERSLVDHPGWSGDVVLAFVIGEGGVALEAQVESAALNNAVLDRCLLEEVGALRFPAPEGGALRVRYPLVFNAE